jgi:hypothetical protein
MEFYELHDQLSKQGLQYDPEDQFYKGDSNMRVNKKRRKSARREEGERRGEGWPKKTRCLQQAMTMTSHLKAR